MTGPIVAIGGGELRELTTLAIDREIVAMTRKGRPRALFIPTASGEAYEYCRAFRDVYGRELGCRTDNLLFLTEKATDEAIRKKIETADLLYVGGGNTKKMIEAWRARGIDELLRAAHRRGALLSGLSAGAICWHEKGFSDSELDETGAYIATGGIGILPGLCCPHYDERVAPFDAFLKTYRGAAIAIENDCAVVYEGGMFRVIRSRKGACAWRFTCGNGETIKERLENEALVRWM